MEWFENFAGPDYAPAILWTFAALVLFLIVLIIIKLIRSLTFGTFVAGGRNRKTRLAVMDAAAVDSHRRLVLVRRDDIEHLLLIGGPTDVVVERDIRIGQPRRPALTGEASHEAQPRPRPAEQAPARPAAPQQVAARQPERPQPPAPQQPARPVAREAPPQPPQPQRQQQPPRAPPAAAAAPQPRSAQPQPQAYVPPPTQTYTQPQQNSLDDALLKELEVSFDEPPTLAGKPVKPQELSLDEEMTKLLGELSSQKR